MRRIIIGVSGASGMPLARAVLENLASVEDLEIHLMISKGAERVLQTEGGGDLSMASLTRHAQTVHDAADMAAGPSSGSWRNDGMIVCPCSMRSLAAIATGTGTNLIHRAADVTLKERRPLLLVVRETPLNRIHLRNMTLATEAGGTIMPFMPAFYNGMVSLEGMMRHFTGRLLDQMGIAHQLCVRWRDDR